MEQALTRLELLALVGEDNGAVVGELPLFTFAGLLDALVDRSPLLLDVLRLFSRGRGFKIDKKTRVSQQHSIEKQAFTNSQIHSS